MRPTAKPGMVSPSRVRHVGLAFSPSPCVGSLPPQRLSLGICPHPDKAATPDRRELSDRRRIKVVNVDA